VDVASALGLVDGLVLACSGTAAVAEQRLHTVAEAAPAERRIVANFNAVAGLGGPVAELPWRVAGAFAAGANELRFYHAGLASAADLVAIRELVAGT